MKKFVKISAIVVVLVVLLVVGAVVALPMLFSPEDLKAELAAKVKEHSGRELRIPGAVDFSVFPWLGVRLGTVELGNAPGFSAPVFAKTEKVDVRVKLRPLLQRRLEMATVTVHGLTLNLEKDAEGRSNWEDLAKGGAPEGVERSDRDASALRLAAFAIGGLDIQSAALSYTDARTGQAYNVKNMSLRTGALSPGEPVDVELGLDFDSAAPPMTGRLTGSASVDADPQTQVAKLSGLDIVADLKGAALPGGATKATLSADAVFDGRAGSLSLDNVKLSALDVDATGTVMVTELDSGGKFTGALAVAEHSPRALLEALGQPDIDTADPKVLTRISLETKLSGSASALTLKPLAVKLDDSRISGEASVSNFSAPAVRFALALDEIDLDRYLPPPAQGKGAPAATPGAAASTAGGLPMGTLRALDVAGTLTATKVRVAKLELSELSAKVNAKSGLIRLSPIGARLYQGEYRGNIVLDARNDTPQLSLDENLAKIQIEPLLEDLQGEAKLTGTGTVSAKLTALGTSPEAIRKSLNGNLSFEFLDGALKGVNIAKMIREAKAKIGIGGVDSATASGPERTDFAAISGTAKVIDGVISNQDLSAMSPLLRVSGKGTASLPAETIDYGVTVTVVATSKGQGGKDLADLAGVPIPLRVSGSFSEPKYGLDVEALAQAVAKSKVKDIVEQQKAKVTEKVQDKLKGSLGEKAGKLLGGEKEGGSLLKNLLGN